MAKAAEKSIAEEMEDDVADDGRDW
jgi:hypothetical protein